MQLFLVAFCLAAAAATGSGAVAGAVAPTPPAPLQPTVAAPAPEFRPVKLGLKKRSRTAPRREIARAAVQRDGHLTGAAYADYSVEVTIGEQVFQVTVDTGSSDLAVSASPSHGCTVYYQGACTGPPASVEYDLGWWSGALCQGPDISLAGLSAGHPSFAAIYQEQDFLVDCKDDGSGIYSHGIVGMAYPGLSDGGVPLFDAVVSTNGISDVFSLQCCAWGGDGTAAGVGSLVLGGTDDSLYSGNIQYTPVTQELYYCVDMTSMRVGKLRKAKSTTRKHRSSTSRRRVHSQGVATPTESPVVQLASCEQDAGTTCYFFSCDQGQLGPSTCQQGRCMCSPGHCAVGGTCLNASALVTEIANVSAAGGAAVVKAQSTARAPRLGSNGTAKTSAQTCATIIDSGTSTLSLQGKFYSTVIGPINRAMARVPDKACVTADDLYLFPDIYMSFGGGVELRITPKRYFQPVPGSTCLELFIDNEGSDSPDTPNILGQVLFEEYYTVFDRVNKRVGFAPIAGCT